MMKETSMRSTFRVLRDAEPAIRTLPFVVAVAGLLLAAGAASAQDTFPGNVPDTFRLRLGGTYAWFNTKVTFQENLTPGGPIGSGVSLEDVLGVPGSTGGFDARGYWNITGRLFMDFGYSGYTRSQTAGLAQDFTFGDSTYTAGSTVSASMKSQLPYLDFRYGIIKTDAMQFGVSLGVAYPILQAQATASAGVIGPNGPIFGQTVTKEAKIEVPVPLLGLQFDTKLGEGLSAGLLFDGIFAPVHPYVGSVFFADAHIDWFATSNLGFGAAFDYTKFSIKKEETNTYVAFAYSYWGPRVYVTLSF
jgi:hypothetical protein